MKALGVDNEINQLSVEEQVVLGALTYQPGFPVLTKLMREACAKATAEVMKVNPEDPKYDELLKSKQLMARAMHEYNDALLKSIELHLNASKAIEAQKELSQIPKEPKRAGVVKEEAKAAIGNPLGGRTTI